MARKGMKRASSMAKRSGGVAVKCRKIAACVRDADDIPKPVRSMLCDNLERTFTTYKEDRHAFQNEASALVGSILKSTQAKLQEAVKAAETKKAAVDAEHNTASAANDAAVGASEAASKALADSKTAITDSKNALKEAKAHLHELEAETKTADSDAAAAATKKETLEALTSTVIPGIKDGTNAGARAGNKVSKDCASSVDPEFLTCVSRTFAKPVATWGTFDNIVAQRLDGFLQKSLAGVTAEIASLASAKETRSANVESAKTAITTAEETAKAKEEASVAAAAAAKEAEAAAAVTRKTLNQHQGHVSKAVAEVKEAEAALAAFSAGAMAAYTEVEARKAPPPPEPEADAPDRFVSATSQPATAAAMAPAPAQPAARPSILSSPQVLMQQARRMLSSPALEQTSQ